VADLDPATVPGYAEAVAALHGYLGDPNDYGMQSKHVGEIVALVMMISRPYLVAEMLADMSDDLALLNGGQDTTDSFILDQTSHDVREYLRVR
jgi:hypothetical protein